LTSALKTCCSSDNRRLGSASSNDDDIDYCCKTGYFSGTMPGKGSTVVGRNHRIDILEGAQIAPPEKCYPRLLQLAGSRRSSLAGMVNGGYRRRLFLHDARLLKPWPSTYPAAPLLAMLLWIADGGTE
jgi:hypothetical protein